MPGPRILIILMGSIGDVARGTCVLKPIKRRFADAKITWIVEPTCAPILRGSPLIDELLIFERNRPVRGLLRLASDLRRREFDVVLDMQRHFKSGGFSLLSRGKRRIGFHPKDSKEGNFIFQTEHIREMGGGVSKVEHYREFLKTLGIEDSGPVEFALEHLREAADFDASAIGPDKINVGMVLGSSWESKDWTVEGWRKLLALLKRDPRFRPVLLGAPEHTRAAEQLMAGEFADCVSYVGRTNLRELSFVLSKMNILVGPDSGPGHIAAGLGVRQVTLFGPTLPARVAPYGSEELSLAPTLGCSPCLRRSCPGLFRICMRLHSPEAVFSRIKAALSL